MGSAELFFFSSLSLSPGGVDIHTSYGRVRRSVHCFFFLDTVRSTPPPIHGPSRLSFCRIFTGSSPCTRTHAQLHPFLSLFLPFIHAHSFRRSFLLTYFVLLFRYFFFLLFFFLFSHLHSRVHVCRVLIFSNI